MHSTTSLVKLLLSEFPEISFTAGEVFAWSPLHKCITYIPNSSDISSLLHELSHALLDHQAYQRDIELIGQERDAWARARKLEPKYGVVIEEAIIEEALNTYRDWLHARSTCPACEATGIQTTRAAYTCLACGAKWHVNSATTCALRRYQIKKRTV